MTEPLPRVAVTGVGLCSALGAGAEASFARLIAGEHGIAPLTLFDAGGLTSRAVAEVSDPAVAAELASGKSRTRTDALAWLAAREALAMARFTPEPGELGLAFGSTTGAMLETEADLALAGPNGALRRAERMIAHPLSATVLELERRLAPRAPFSRRATLCSACSSSALAVVEGAHWIVSGQARAVLAGGADALCRMTVCGFASLSATAPAPCRPFDVARAGLTLGEGAGFLLLEAEASARARGATVLAWLSGWSVGAEGHHITQPEPSGARAASLIAAALASAGLAPSELDYVNAHGTGTLANDRMEATALAAALGSEISRVRVSSSKGQIGHTLGAAGGMEAAITVLALARGVAPPTVGLETPEAPELRHVRGRGERAELRAALSNSFGFGGLGTVLAFERADAPPRARPALARGIVATGAAIVAGGLRVGKELLGPAPSSDANLDPAGLLAPERSRHFDRAAAWVSAAGDALLGSSPDERERTGLCIGNAYGPIGRTLRFMDRVLARGLNRAVPAEFPQLVLSAIAGNASVYLGVKGPVASVCDGALSAESAFARALGWLELGLAPRVLCGAVDAEDAALAALCALVAPPPAGLARREGAGFVALELESAARARGVVPLARLAAHAEERGEPTARGVLARAPRVPATARLIVAASDARLDAAIARSPWAAVPTRRVAQEAGTHDALGAVAQALAVSLVAAGASEVLVVSGQGDARALTRWIAPAEAAEGEGV